jgi:multidrug resistance efflux pump
MKWLLLFCLTSAAGGLACRQCLSHRNGGTAPPARAAEPAGTAALEMQGIGYVEPVSEVRRLMMRAGGVIKECRVRVGDFVRKGQTLLELEDATPRAEVEVARKNLELARAEADFVNAGINPYRLKVAEKTAERLREKLRHCRTEAQRNHVLFATRAATSQEYESTDTQRRQTEAELKEQEAELEHLRHNVTPEQKAMLEAKVRHARANLELAEEKLQETRLLAPFDGTVLKLLKREGEGVKTFEPEPVVLFGDMSRVRVRAEMDERFVRYLEVGQAATVYGRNLAGRTFCGRVACLEHLMGNKTVFTRASSERKDLDVLEVLIDLGPDFHAPAGLQVDVQIEGPGDPADGGGEPGLLLSPPIRHSPK